MTLETKIIEHCAPTLAGMKTANMFNYPCRDRRKLWEEIDRENRILAPKGVHVDVLRFSEKNGLIYVYRREKLGRDLRRSGVSELLLSRGYRDADVDHCLDRLKERLSLTECFPHEIGIFLDYPLEDVKGFIEHGGRNCKYCGIWKVYCNEHESRKLFAKFRRCTDVYIRTFRAGRSLADMTVPVSR